MTKQYKLIKSIGFDDVTSVFCIEKNISIPVHPENSDYQQFIKDVAEQGYDIVEGPDVVHPSYVELRKAEYPEYADQFDKIFHDGIDAWKTEIQSIKDKYPKDITARTDIGPLPDWLYQEINDRIYNQQLRKYIEAVERLAQYRLIETQNRIVDEVLTDGVYYTVETQPYIKGLPADDPRAIQDEVERAEAQAVIDSTPQNIIDAINN